MTRFVGKYFTVQLRKLSSTAGAALLRDAVRKCPGSSSVVLVNSQRTLTPVVSTKNRITALGNLPGTDSPALILFLVKDLHLGSSAYGILFKK